MLDVLPAAQQRLFDPEEPQDIAVATIIGTEGSVPRPVGTSMLVDAAGAIHGSLTGGCVEGAVLVACRQALDSGLSTVQRFGYSDDDAFAVGLMCGGKIDVLIQSFRAGCSSLRQEAGRSEQSTRGSNQSTRHSVPIAMIMRLPAATHEESLGTCVISRNSLEFDAERDAASLAAGLAGVVPPSVLDTALRRAEAMIRSGRTGSVRVAPPDDEYEPIELFIETRTPPAHLIIVGANAFGQALVEAARPLGHRITLCDPRPAFTDPTSFPGAEVVRAWPHRFLIEAAEAGELDERSMICVLSHDPKVDIPTLVHALGLDIGYVGAMGSRRSDRDRRHALQEAGVDSEALARLHSPIGLDLDALTPAEVAVSILAEILTVRGGRNQAAPLSGRTQVAPPSRATRDRPPD
ncbi:XdhC family protein [Brevibacterium sandarakinum]|uniref:XdhC family protein n=1 Tax=Brevibacterium sandarakinum TaxID=629680 RepID=UPI00264BC88F|nr:XdhC/CoxI family protein [Brevibacterium sandarakinum]MDN5658056.1 XdhC family protein [Brevibacterium sandarakinum]